MFPSMLQNTPASATSSPTPITIITDSWWCPSPHGWTTYSHLPITSYMPPSSKAPWPTRHFIPYPTSLPMTLLPNPQSSSRFTQPFALFSPGPPGVQQVPLTPFRPPPLRNLPPSLPLDSASLRHKNSPSTFYMLRNSTIPSSSSYPPSSILFSPLSFFHSWKANNYLSMQITPFLLASPKPIRQLPPSPPPTAPS